MWAISCTTSATGEGTSAMRAAINIRGPFAMACRTVGWGGGSGQCPWLLGRGNLGAPSPVPPRSPSPPSLVSSSLCWSAAVPRGGIRPRDLFSGSLRSKIVGNRESSRASVVLLLSSSCRYNIPDGPDIFLTSGGVFQHWRQRPPRIHS